jgi:hypothetical protein
LAGVHRTNQPNAEIVKSLHQRQVAPQRVTILDREIHDLLASRRNALRIIRLERQGEAIGIPRHHRVNAQGNLNRRVTRRRMPFRSPRPLRRKQRPKPTVHSALNQTRQIHLRHVLLVGVTLRHIPTRPREAERRIKMGIQHQRTLVQRTHFRRHYRQRGGYGHRQRSK